MGKKSTVEVTEKILEAMSSNSEQGLVIQDISKKADVSWDCTKRHLESFVKSKIVREYKKEGKPHYQMMCPIAKSDTLFSLPLSEEHRRTIKKIYATIKIVWKQITNKPLSKTLAQKIAVDVVEQKYKDIPRGWYLYGELLVLSFEAEEDYQETLTKKEEVDCVRAVCRDYLDYCDASYKIRRHQYEKKGNKLYLIKEDLMYCLGYSDFNDSAQKMKIRQLKSGKVMDKSILALNEVETPEDLEKGTAVFVYSKGQEYWFHEAGKPQNRFVLKEEFIGTQGKFLKSQMEVNTLSFDGKIIKINLPVKYEYKIVEAPPAVKGATAAGGGKPAKIETGAMVSVPMFVEAGDVIIVNTEKGEYVSKA